MCRPGSVTACRCWYSGEELVSVSGVVIAAEYQADGHEAAIRVELRGARTGKS